MNDKSDQEFSHVAVNIADLRIYNKKDPVLINYQSDKDTGSSLPAP